MIHLHDIFNKMYKVKSLATAHHSILTKIYGAKCNNFKIFLAY